VLDNSSVVWKNSYADCRALSYVAGQNFQVSGRVDSVKRWMTEDVGETKLMCRLVVQQLADEIKQENVLLVRLCLHIPLIKHTHTHTHTYLLAW